MKLSIIMPAYNVEKYIENSVQSVLELGSLDFELIIIDDGSTDGTPQICDRLSRLNKKIRIIHQNNMGVSKARNRGINIAKGEFIFFIDSDDRLHAKNFMTAFKHMTKKKLDMLTCDYSVNQLVEQEAARYYEIKETQDYITHTNDIPWGTWRTIYSTSLIKANNVKFDDLLTCAEDCDFFMRATEKAQRREYSNLKIIKYNYGRDNSITNSINSKNILDQMNVFSKMAYRYQNSNNGISALFANKFVNSIIGVHKIKNKTEIEKVNSFIDDNKKLLSRTKGAKYAIASATFYLLGYRSGSAILDKIRTIL